MLLAWLGGMKEGYVVKSYNPKTGQGTRLQKYPKVRALREASSRSVPIVNKTGIVAYGKICSFLLKVNKTRVKFPVTLQVSDRIIWRWVRPINATSSTTEVFLRTLCGASQLRHTRWRVPGTKTVSFA